MKQREMQSISLCFIQTGFEDINMTVRWTVSVGISAGATIIFCLGRKCKQILSGAPYLFYDY